MDFSPPVWLHSVLLSLIRMFDLENVGLAVDISFLSHLQAEISFYRYFKFIGRHLGFSSSGLVVQCSKCFRWNADPRKHGSSRWNFVTS